MTPEGTHDSITLLIGNTTPLEDIVSLLVQHGCMDLTSFIPTANAPTIAYEGGGACDVYEWKLCTDTPIGLISMPVAIKTLRCSSNSNAEARLPKRAAKELYTWLQLDHPNILPLLGFAIFKGRLSMVSSWMPNGNLSSYLQRNEVSSMDRIAFCKQIREGLVYIHSKGMAHGDLKPANIMISDEGMAMISDFGNTFLKDLALSFAPTSTFSVTYWYAAPEHLASETPLVATKESDVYSYGLTVLEILSGEMPFKNKTHHWMIMQASRETLFPTRPSEIDDYIWSALLPCWAHDPSNRPSILDVYLSEPGGGGTILTQLSNSRENLPLNIFETFGGLPVPNLEGASVAPCPSVEIDQSSSWFNWNEIPQSESGMTTSIQPTGSAIGNLHTGNFSLSHASSCDRTWTGYFSNTRSTGGCTTCRRKRKKCDETQPECLRCQRIGVTCEGYVRFENPDRKDIMRRARSGPSKISHRSATSTSAQFNQKLSAAVPSEPFRVPEDESKRPVVPSGTVTTSNIDRFIIKDISAERDAQNHTAHDKHRTELKNSAPSDAHVSSARPVVSNPPPPPQTIVSTDFPGGIQTVDALPTINLACIGLAGGLPHDFHSNAFSPNSTSASPPYDLASVDSTGSNSQSSQNHQPLTSGQASLYYSLLSLGCPSATLPEVVPQTATTLALAPLRGPSQPSLNTCGDDEDDADEDDSETSEDDGFEDVKQAMCTTIIPDANVEANALPFVLQSYAQWINFMVFDPKNVVHVIREGIIAQFSSSQEIRTRVILLSNVFGALGKSPVLNSKVRSVVTYLSAEAHQSITRFNSTEPAYSREMDMMNALKSIDPTMEVILLRRFGGSISTIVGLVEAASPVFRRACPEPLGQLVNLPNILVSPSINLRHYAETDIMTATLLARRMFLRYDILYTPEINEQFIGPQAGLHWLHGIPDQLIILLAWINMLHEDYGTNVDPLLISQIGKEVERVKITPNTSDDPIYTVRRFAVQECWRLVVYIHLHVTLCGAHAEDPRVVKYVKRFMRFLGGIKPARNVDTFLSLPMMFIGSFVSRKQDRDLLFRRLSTMQECTMPGRAGHDSLMVLCDIWKRTEQEQRPAVWADLRFSCEMIVGV